MEAKYKVGIAVAALATSFAFGRFTVPEKIKIETKTVEVEKKVEDVKTDKHRIITKVRDIKPDGSSQTTTTVTEDTTTDKKDKVAKDTSTESKSETTRGDSKVTISGLVGMQLNNPTVDYGINISKPVLGPITLNIFGLSNLTFGFGLGLTF